LGAHYPTEQESENEVAEVVIVCEPEQASLMMGGLHPRGSLYERPINIDTAKTQHAEFRTLLRSYGLRVLTVREILAYNVSGGRVWAEPC
jgi:arginine deiminase